MTQDGAHPPTPSLLRDSTARLAAEGTGVLFMLLTGMITARALGPQGKGVVATLSYVIVVFGHIGVAGLGDAAVVMSSRLTGEGSSTVAPRLSMGVLALSVMSAMAAIGFLMAATPQVAGAALALASAGVVLWALSAYLTSVINARGGVVMTSLVYVIQTTVTTAATATLVLGLRWGVTGAVLALTLGTAAACAVLLTHLWRRGRRLAARIDVGIMRQALAIGVPSQAAVLLQVLSSRVDVLVVLALAGTASAGHYSVAVTAGQMAMYAPFALAVAAFPRLARESDEASRVTLLRLTRLNLAAGLTVAISFAIITPLLIPLIFGPGFGPAVRPALVLLASGVLAGQQLLFTRALAARGKPGTLWRSYSASLVALLALDALLVPPMELMGAALASVISPIVGLAVLWSSLVQALPAHIRPSDLAPRGQDLRELARLLKEALAAVRTTIREAMAAPRSH